jgi:hypothetical protein
MPLPLPLPLPLPCRPTDGNQLLLNAIQDILRPCGVNRS